MARWGPVVAAAVVALGGGAAPVGSAPALTAKVAPPTLGMLHEGLSTKLVRIDRSLHALPGARLEVGLNTFAWSLSPEGSMLALGGDGNGTYVPDVLLVETSTLRSLGRVRLARRGWVVATGWAPGGLLRAVISHEHVTVATVDAARRTVVASRSLEGQVLHVAHSRDALVLLLGSATAIVPARVAVVRPSGEIDVAVLRGVQAGSEKTGRADGAEFRGLTPALAVDPDRGLAFVVPATGDVAEIELDGLRVTYHALAQRISLLGRLAHWLEPEAHAKSIEGPTRHARMRGSLLVVSGGDYSVSRKRPPFTPAGVRVIDTRTWSARSIAPGADGFYLAGDVVLGMSAHWSSELHYPRRIGVDAYGLDGRRRFHLYDGNRAWVIYADGQRAYVDPAGPGPVDVVAVRSGRILERRASVPWPLVGTAQAAME
jgi:hypothetical protein